MSNTKLDNLGKYRIIEEIGIGRFSTVYLSEHFFLKKSVAIKLMDTDVFNTSEIIQNFIRDIKDVAAIKHDNISQVMDLVENQNRIFMVLEYLSGNDLRSYQAKNGRLNFLQITNVINDIATALDYAHSLGFVHGDVKPGNILLSDTGIAKLADLGVLSAVEKSGAVSADLSRATPQYMSPEQADGGLPTPLSDQYSLGIVAYELFTGNVPFNGENPLAIYLKHVREKPTLPSNFNPLITPQLESILIQAISKNPPERFADCRSFARALLASGSYTASEQYQGLIDRISAALDSGDTDTAHPLLEYGLQLMPESAQERATLLQLKAHEQAIISYRKSSVAIDVARDNSDILLEHFAPTADPHGVFSGLNPEPDPAWLSFIIHWRFAIATILLLGFLGIIGGFAGFTYSSMLPAESSTKSTMVAIIRSPTPIPPTSTQTPTASPVNTLAPTFTFTPSSTPTSTPIPTLGIGSISIRQNDKMRMVYIPAGSFTMGSGTKNEEKPVKLITLDAYWIDEIEVTNSMYQLCVLAKSCPDHTRNASFSHADYYTSPEYALFPVLQVTWHQAVSYCNWAGGRLPSEAEWEKAARGSDERIFPWGNSIDPTFANYSRSVGDTTAGGSYQKGASPYGVLDMSGNVIEWVNSLFMPYPYSGTDGREDPTAYGARVLRGGNWSDNANNVRASYRAKFLPTNQGDHIGFRCAGNPTP